MVYSSISNHYEEQEMNLNLAICDDEIKDIELLKKHILLIHHRNRQ